MSAHLSWQLEYMYALERFGVKMGLGVMKSLLKGLGDPQKKFKSVHITGTNGKGSVAAMTATVLNAAGYKTGLYTSPHIAHFNERIQVSGKAISDKRLSGLIERVQKAAEGRRLQPTFFEFSTAVALLYLAEEEVEIGIIEAGMGGRLDATNVLQPEVAVVTNIGHDHTRWLGSTRREIATDKVGIVKPGCTFVYGGRDLEDVFARAHWALGEVQVELVSETLDGQVFDTGGLVEGRFELPLLGTHQLDNAAVALVAQHYLNERGFAITPEAMRVGLASVKWPGRMQVVQEDPLILVDGAHNPEGVNALYEFLQSHISKYGTKPQVLVLGVKRDKELPEMFRKIVPMFASVITTEGNYEPMAADELAKNVREHNKNVEVVPDVARAIATGRQKLKRGEMMLVTGSLYMIGDALAAFPAGFEPAASASGGQRSDPLSYGN